MDYATSLIDDETVFVHAYDDPEIVAGQGTLGLEILDQIPDLDTVIVPIGGGGLIGGIATAIGELNLEIRIVGVQAEGAGAASIAAVLSDQLDIEGKTVVPLLSGGNLSMTDLKTVLTHALTYRGKFIQLRIRIIDEPGNSHNASVYEYTTDRIRDYRKLFILSAIRSTRVTP